MSAAEGDAPGSPALAPPGCANCAAVLAGRYCQACGQDSQTPETGWLSWLEQWHRLVRTVRTLLVEPGRLTTEHLAGARVRYIPPFTLFLNAVAVFFLFAVATKFQLRDILAQNETWFGPLVEAQAAAAGLPAEAFVQRAERRFQGIYTLSLAIVSVAGYTLAYKALFWRALPGWRGAFTAALHYLAFIFIFFLPWMLVAPAIAREAGRGTFVAAMALPVACAIAWNAFAARRLGRHGWPLSIAKGLAVVVFGFLIDGFMSWIAVQATLRLA